MTEKIIPGLASTGIPQSGGARTAPAVHLCVQHAGLAVHGAYVGYSIDESLCTRRTQLSHSRY